MSKETKEEQIITGFKRKHSEIEASDNELARLKQRFKDPESIGRKLGTSNSKVIHKGKDKVIDEVSPSKSGLFSPDPTSSKKNKPSKGR